MSRILMLGALGVLLGCVGAACYGAGPSSADHRKSAVEIDAKLAEGPEGIYSRTCGYCHGTNVGPILLGKDYPPEAIVYMVRNGKGAMPAFRPTEISDAELRALGSWISTSKPAAGDRGN